VIHTASSKNKETGSRNEKPSKSASDGTRIGAHGETAAADGVTTPTDSAGGTPHQRRRFYLSRKDMIDSSDRSYSRFRSGVSKKRMPTVVFVERKIKSLPSRKVEDLALSSNRAQGLGASSASNVSYDSASATTPDASEALEATTAEPKRYKRPGVNRLARNGSTKPPKPLTELPDAITDRWNVDLERLTTEMNAFTMDQIAKNLEQAEEEKAMSQPASKPPKRRFKPIAPAKRYAERHPAAKEELDAQAKAAANDVEMRDLEEGEYTEQTYVRVPLSTMDKHQVDPRAIGYLAFEQDPDAEYFYGDPNDSDDEYAEDDEDENGRSFTSKHHCFKNLG
jgi:hypothetical protein